MCPGAAISHSQSSELFRGWNPSLEQAALESNLLQSGASGPCHRVLPLEYSCPRLYTRLIGVVKGYTTCNIWKMEGQKKGVNMRKVENRQQYIAKQCRLHRSRFGWTQEDLAHEAGVRLSTIQRMESGTEGKDPSLDTLWRASEAFGISVAELLPHQLDVDSMARVPVDQFPKAVEPRADAIEKRKQPRRRADRRAMGRDANSY
jgi:transcriptional regulator with XRE-family HTH domain